MSAPGAEGRRAATRLRLVSWNVHGTPDAPGLDERMRAIARVVTARKPALVLLQEVWRRRDAQAFEKRLARKGYEVVRAPMRSSGLLGFVHASAGWRASEPRSHALGAAAPGGELREDAGPGEEGVQGFTLSGEGFTCEVLNTHLEAADEPGGQAGMRRAQLAELRALAEAPEGRLVLVAGDLSTTPDEPAWGELGALRDLTARLREGCRCGTSVEAEEPERWLDHLLARAPAGWRVEAEVSLLRSQRPDVPYSDHHGLDAVLEIATPARAAPLAALAAARLGAPTTRRELLANAALWWLAR